VNTEFCNQMKRGECVNGAFCDGEYCRP
jgi:hypothetical protein